MSDPSREPAGADELRLLRQAIDDLDLRLVDLLAQRLDLARRTTAPKQRAGLPVQDLAREAEVVRRAADAARDRGLDPEPIRDIYWRLVDLARRAQQHSAPSAGTAAPTGGRS